MSLSPELSKRLKDAGFPQPKTTGEVEGEVVFAPSLEGLIEVLRADVPREELIVMLAHIYLKLKL